MERIQSRSQDRSLGVQPTREFARRLTFREGCGVGASFIARVSSGLRFRTKIVRDGFPTASAKVCASARVRALAAPPPTARPAMPGRSAMPNWLPMPPGAPGRPGARVEFIDFLVGSARPEELSLLERLDPIHGIQPFPSCSVE